MTDIHKPLLFKQPLKLCTLNVNSIKSTTKMALLSDTIDRINPHVMVITESKIDQTYNPKFQDYYTVTREDRDSNGGGVVCLARNGVKCHATKETSIGKYVQICSFQIKSLLIIAVYKSPQTSAVDERKLISKLAELLSTLQDTVLMGDLNLPKIPTVWCQPAGRPLGALEKEWLDMARLANLTQHVTDPTYRQTGSTLDLVLTTPGVTMHNCLVKPHDVDPVFDHFPVIAELQSAPIIKNMKRLHYKESPETWQVFKDALFYMPVKRILDSPPTTKQELEDTCIELVDAIMHNYKTATPSYIHTTNGKHPWMTNMIRKQMNSIRTLNRNAKNEPCRPRRQSMYQRLAMRRKRLAITIKNTQKEYQKNIIKNCNKNSKRFFSLIESFKPQMPSVGPIPVRGALTDDEEEMAEEFNGYLTSFFGHKQELLSTWVNFQDTWHLPGTAVFINKIKQLKTQSAPGDDGITPSMIKHGMGTLAPILAVLTKCVMDLGYFPKCFKRTKVRMLHKKGCRQTLKNYRPIALISILGKLIESAMTDELVRQLEESGVLDHCQHGFRSANGCHTALLSMWQGISDSVESHGGCSIVGLDLTKAFDLADHQILLEELSTCNVEFKLGEVVRSWLEDRVQFVQIGKKRSTESHVNASVVQGSRLGPVLWLVYINGLLKKLRKIKQPLSAYADDIILYGPINSPAGINKFDRSLEIIESWSRSHKMQFSATKSNYMRIGKQMPFCPMLNGNAIPYAKEMLILGVVFTENGRFNRMAKRVTDAANYKVRVLRNNLKYRDTKSMTLLYNAFIKSRLFYCSQVWHQRNAAVGGMLQRTCKNFWRLSHSGRPPEILTVNEQLFYNDIQQARSIKTGRTIARCYRLHECNGDVREKNAGKFRRQKATCFVTQNEFSRRAAYQWNWLPTAMRMDSSKHGFLPKLRVLVLGARSAADTRSRLPVLP